MNSGSVGNADEFLTESWRIERDWRVHCTPQIALIRARLFVRAFGTRLRSTRHAAYSNNSGTALRVSAVR